ncbi:unnamed protein product [Triticum turgidum subsp. durum]|uniref:Peptidase S9 prolyl oligopeptidase catalytic domain-containing protein n=1 Tax=Triticum turgidum subsp. durum TaxID=4567 RepID=A0A9R0QEA2_TRITD|nr:unnamed protein product [Triticum turgidum subsp. durum]
MHYILISLLCRVNVSASYALHLCYFIQYTAIFHRFCFLLLGGNAVLLYASMYHDVTVIVNISGRFALEQGMEGRLGKNFLQRIKKDGYIDVRNKKGKFEYRVTEESLRDRLSTDTLLSSRSISKDCRVLTVHGSEDETVPARDALMFAANIPNHDLHIVVGANHRYTGHEQELTSLVLDFIKPRPRKSSSLRPKL